MRIAVDAQGGDNAPSEVISGALAAARGLPGDEVILVGELPELKEYLKGAVPPNITLKESEGPARMGEDPTAALRARPRSGIAVAAKMVRSGEAEALFSAGSTGATVAAALLLIGRIPGCRRPAIATIIPFKKPALLLDVGATVQCRAQDLLIFAKLGSAFSSKWMGVSNPRVGLINIGEEPGKGNDLAKEAHKLMLECATIRFIGNVEGRDIGGEVADVLVTDGFTGNVMLKTAEGVARDLLGMVHSAVTGDFFSRLAAGVLRNQLLKVKEQIDPESYGGSFLLGVQGTVVIGHGNSKARGVENAIKGISRAGTGLDLALEESLRERGEV